MLYLRGLCGFRHQSGFYFKIWSPKLRSVRARTPAKIDGNARAARTYDVLPYDVFVDATALVTNVSELGES